MNRNDCGMFDAVVALAAGAGLAMLVIGLAIAVGSVMSA